jgi:4-hydroxybenzoate polyprenyltransferase
MQSRTGKIVMGVLALAMALAFFAPPVIKLKEPAMIIVILIGVAAMVYNFIEVLRDKDDS